ncbi:MAG: RnfABCDGE type electron transport complex subunit D [Planctomycetota bacterium]|jgi:electron transport complex protein RnfD
MTDETKPQADADAPMLHVAPSPHVDERATTQRMMLDVLIALVPVLLASVIVFRHYAVIQLAICVGSCVVAEAVFTAIRRKPVSVLDGSVVVTGAILALSLPGTCPWYVGVIAGVTAVGLGKVIFGGLGQNIFNPAMVGRAFVMICFASALGASAYVDKDSPVEAVTKATPMTVAKEGGSMPSLDALLLGNTNGSLGETSALACLIGGLYLCVRRTAAWQIPLGVLLAVVVIASVVTIAGGQTMGVWEHLLGGALMFGAMFIATDPVTSPLTPRGRFIFGLGVGAAVMLLRLLSNYPEGVMFAVLLMNALVPLINRWTIPAPVGGPVPLPKKA